MKRYIQPIIKCHQIHPANLLQSSTLQLKNQYANGNYEGGGDAKKNNMWVFMDDDEE